MNHAHQEQTGGAPSAQPKLEWDRPELTRLDPAAAEASDITGSDGTFTS